MGTSIEFMVSWIIKNLKIKWKNPQKRGCNKIYVKCYFLCAFQRQKVFQIFYWIIINSMEAPMVLKVEKIFNKVCLLQPILDDVHKSCCYCENKWVKDI
jgi:hypothetical protein